MLTFPQVRVIIIPVCRNRWMVTYACLIHIHQTEIEFHHINHALFLSLNVATDAYYYYHLIPLLWKENLPFTLRYNLDQLT